MDHLQKVRDPIRKPIVVPFVCADLALHSRLLSFNDYEAISNKYAYSTHDNLQNLSHPQFLTQNIKFLQSWLFFGLLVQVLGPTGVTPNRDDFLRVHDNGELVITTEALPKYLWFWLAVRHHQPRHEAEDHVKLADSCLKLANRVLNSLSTHKLGVIASTKQELQAEDPSSSNGGEWSAARRVLLSLVILGETLCHARNHIVTYSVGPALHWEYPPLGSLLLQRAGWCIAEIRSLFRHCGVSTLYYLSTWDRVILQKDHSRCGSSTTCQSHQLNPKTYKTQHVAGCRGCEEHGLSSEAISAILIPDRTVVPLITVDFQRAHSPIEVVAADISRVEAVPSYVAVSHVWSDGRGNPLKNFLPSCQLQHLQDCINALYPSERHPVPFWMDTLCVPVGRKFWPVRNRALNRMKSTYKSAEKIIVFDTSLELMDSSIAPEEAVIRIRYSPWSSRLWTMQEGRLGQNVYFQFRSKCVSFDSQPYQNGASGNLRVVDKILSGITTQNIAYCPPALLLVRALAYTDQTLQLRLSYARKPPQADPAEEDIRISAIESLQDLKFEDNLHRTWLPIAKKLVGETYEASRLDDGLRSDIHATIMSPIISHCGEAWLRTRGFSYHIVLNRLSGTDQFRPGTKPFHVFDDTARGLQGRTTSRIEDEPVCLCALLGLDNTRVLDIPVPSPRRKRILTSISSKPKLATLCRNMGFDAQSTLSQCHDQRMKAVLQLVDVLPPHIIFWNVPRLQEKGWHWAPSTLLSEDTQIRSRASVYAERRDEGLLVGFPGWRITLEREVKTQKALRKNGRVVLIIDNKECEGLNHPFRRSWMRSRLQGSRKRWRSVFARNRDLALVVDEGRGVLVTVQRVADGICFANFEAPAERFPPSAPLDHDTVFSGTATWVEYPRWCIG